MEVKILSDRNGYLAVIAEQRASWVSFVLDSLGLDLEFIEEAEKDEVFEYLMEENIDIVDYPDLGAVRISYGRETVGEWANPEFLMKQDKETGDVYYEITIENWTIFDEGMEEELDEFSQFFEEYFGDEDDEDDHDYDGEYYYDDE